MQFNFYLPELDFVRIWEILSEFFMRYLEINDRTDCKSSIPVSLLEGFIA